MNRMMSSISLAFHVVHLKPEASPGSSPCLVSLKMAPIFPLMKPGHFTPNTLTGVIRKPCNACTLRHINQ